jgi:hypothetical protein
MPRSNKRTAGLAKSPTSRSAEPPLHSARIPASPAAPGHSPMPDPCMADPCLSGQAGSTHHQDSNPSAILASSPWTHTMPGYLPLGNATGSTTTGIPATYLHQSPALSQSHSLPGYLLPRSPPPFWPCWTPATCGMTRHLPLGLPLIRPAGLQPHV